jgi:hypothetical protein
MFFFEKLSTITLCEQQIIIVLVIVLVLPKLLVKSFVHPEDNELMFHKPLFMCVCVLYTQYGLFCKHP